MKPQFFPIIKRKSYSFKMYSNPRFFSLCWTVGIDENERKTINCDIIGFYQTNMV